MENLIKKSYEISERSYYVNPNGIQTPMYESFSVSFEKEDDKYYYTISRSSLSSAYNMITMVKKGKYSNKRYDKLYQDNVKFENAIKRIQKLISNN
jgi:hypothetical protein